MNDTAIRVEGLSKLYRLGARESYRTLRDTLTNTLTAPFRWLQSKELPNATGKAEAETIWALKDISFEVRHGEVLGIIGRNGAGKSTLLKILSRITEPTRGHAEIHGRVGSLLEVGTGFHPELTGRENIFLNGAILGMKKAEILRKFDEIVAFAEIEKFVDTPVKHYSSGMYVRLAFAVAAHLEPEILIIDEVLAVGDARFQEKCLGLMQQTATRGRTILFVSHNMAAVQSLCDRAILLADGGVQMDGVPAEVTSHYFSDAESSGEILLNKWSDRKTSGEATITRLSIQDRLGRKTASIPFRSDVQFEIEARFDTPVMDPAFGVLVHGSVGDAVLDIRSTHSNWRLGRVIGPITLSVSLKELCLYPGTYLISPWIMDAACHYDIDYVRFCATLSVAPAAGPSGDLRLDPNYGKYWIPSLWSRSVPACYVTDNATDLCSGAR